MQAKTLEDLLARRAVVKAIVAGVDLERVKERTFNTLYGIFTESPIRPEGAHFVVGRMFQAFQEYVEVVDAEAELRKLNAQIDAIYAARKAVEVS